MPYSRGFAEKGPKLAPLGVHLPLLTLDTQKATLSRGGATFVPRRQEMGRRRLWVEKISGGSRAASLGQG